VRVRTLLSPTFTDFETARCSHEETCTEELYVRLGDVVVNVLFSVFSLRQYFFKLRRLYSIKNRFHIGLTRRYPQIITFASYSFPARPNNPPP